MGYDMPAQHHPIPGGFSSFYAPAYMNTNISYNKAYYGEIKIPLF